MPCPLCRRNRLSNGSLSKWKIFSFPILALVSCAAGAWAQAPSVLVDAQQTIATGFNTAQSIAVSKNGTIYIANTTKNQIVAVVNGVNTPVSTGTFVLTMPQALALDANGDLFVGDTPTTGTTSSGRIIELAGDGKGNLTGVATSVFSGAPLTNPISLAVDSAGMLFIGDYPPSGDGAIYSLALGWHAAAAECHRPQHSVHSCGVVEGCFDKPLHRRQWQLHGKRWWRLHRA